MELSCLHLGGSLSVDAPWTGAIDRVAVHIKPLPDREQHFLDLLRNGTVSAWSDVDQQISILAYDVCQLMHDKLRRLEGVVLDVAPGVVADRGIGLPVERPYLSELASLEVEHA